MTLQHLRSSTANKRPDPTAMADGQIALNTAAASPGLFYKDSAGNLVKAGPVHVGSTAPNVSPASGGTAGNSTGESWLDTSGSNPLLKIWSGAAWQTVQPVASGTVVSTADTGSVTSTMIADGTIVNADINASAAIAGSKISPDFGAQNVTTTGTSTAASFIPTSSTVPTNGLYLPSAGSVAISTAGSGRLFVDSIGNIGVGTSSPASNGSTFATLSLNGSNGGAQHFMNAGSTVMQLYNDANAFFVNAYTGKQVIIQTGGSERLRITSAGLVGVGTSSPGTHLHVAPNDDNAFNTGVRVARTTLPGQYVNMSNYGGSASFVAVDTAGGAPNFRFQTSTDASTLSTRMVIDSSGRVGIGSSNPQQLLHIDAGATGANAALTIRTTGWAGNQLNLITRVSPDTVSVIQSTERALLFDVNGSERARIDTSGRLGIGTSPSYKLHVSDSSTNVALIQSSNSGAYIAFQDSATSTATSVGIGSTGNSLAFYANSSERGRFDASGRLLVGTSTGTNNIRLDQKIAVVSTGGNFAGAALTSYGGTSASVRPVLDFNRSRGTTDGSMTAVAADDFLGTIVFRGSDGTQFVDGAFVQALVDGSVSTNDLPTRLVFSTCPDSGSSPVERLRITNDGRFWFGNTSSLGNFKYHLPFGGGSQNGLILRNTDNSGSPSAVAFEYGTTQVGYISVNSTTTTYNTSSDYRLKENVTAVTDGITRLQQLKPSRFNFIADPAKTVDGFLAHEAAEVVPECVTGEKDAVDDDGNPIYQGIDQSKLVPLLTAALQEAVAKIESLEARLTAAGI